MWALLCLMPICPSVPERIKCSILVLSHFGQKEREEICTTSKQVFDFDNRRPHLHRETEQFSHQEHPPRTWKQLHPPLRRVHQKPLLLVRPGPWGRALYGRRALRGCAPAAAEALLCLLVLTAHKYHPVPRMFVTSGGFARDLTP